MDLLYDHLIRARATGAVFARTVAEPPWGMRLSGSIQLGVHAVVRGRGWLWTDTPGSAVELSPGTVVLVRGGPDHYVGDQPGAHCVGPEEFGARHPLTEVDESPRATVFLCGAYRFSGEVGRALLDALPQVMTLTPALDDPLRDVITLLSRELGRTRPAQQIVLDRLLDLLLVLAIRSDFEQNTTAPRWYRASADPRLGAALRAMHENAAHPWTVPELAAISGLSRAAFARAFQEKLGQAPMRYLTEWRMTLARDHLRDGDLSLARVAEAVGYASPFAFTAAFRRHHGSPPGVWRKAEQTAAAVHRPALLHSASLRSSSTDGEPVAAGWPSSATRGGT
ncbi:AraC family transcriptional regulator [Herbidospora sp. NBRC 101105]|uniref:AraC family transcriptional regulator n=1 Tax=Herbidospora sp. NBRC 101105 TaxID=3032195 RepID=UPI00255559DB|nr:AraC family transcriptional regulator [Herbidospora sp. NBRC 101105]